MPFGKEKLVTFEQEKILKRQLKKLRDKGLSAREIAKKLGFGQPGHYQKLNFNHVYMYVRHFNLKIKERKT